MNTRNYNDNDDKNWLVRHKTDIVKFGLIPVAFLVGLALPSPFFRYGIQKVIGNKSEELVDTINMAIGGGIYSGSIVKNTCTRNGYGRFETQSGSVYEGEWKDDKLRFGTRTTASSVYTGRFDAELNNDGFGIINYTESYIKGKSSQGLSDSEIIVTYIGNWSKDNKQGLGRSIKKDGSMEFGRYSKGLLQKTAGANYRIGGSVYGIDVSHFQHDIDWDNLALFCDKNGNVYKGNPKDKSFMQPVFFAYMKATEGATVKDEMFNVRIIEAERHGITKGAYHFLRLGSPIDEQLKNFFETVTWSPGDLPPALDVELEDEINKYGVKQFQSKTLEWLERVEKRMGVRPIIYTREGIRNKYLNTPEFKKYKFWIARYSEKGPDNFDWQIWQNSEHGRINGYKGNIDINIFKGDYDSFKNFLKE